MWPSGSTAGRRRGTVDGRRDDLEGPGGEAKAWRGSSRTRIRSPSSSVSSAATSSASGASSSASSASSVISRASHDDALVVAVPDDRHRAHPERLGHRFLQGRRDRSRRRVDPRARPRRGCARSARQFRQSFGQKRDLDLLERDRDHASALSKPAGRNVRLPAWPTAPANEIDPGSRTRTTTSHSASRRSKAHSAPPCRIYTPGPDGSLAANGSLALRDRSTLRSLEAMVILVQSQSHATNINLESPP